MQLNTITVTASRSFPNPLNTYEKFEPKITLTAEVAGLSPNEQESAVKDLQQQAETLVESHKAKMIEDLQKLNRASRLSNEIEMAKRDVKRRQEDLVRLQNESTQLGVPLPLPDAEVEEVF